MTTPTTPTKPPATTFPAPLEAPPLEAAAEAAVSDTEEAEALALEAREGPDPFDGLAIGEPVDEGP
jgi:hypothetical protein